MCLGLTYVIVLGTQPSALRWSQCSVLLVVTKAYRTAPGISLPVITGVLLIDLLVHQRARTFLHNKEVLPYEGGIPTLRRDVIARWQREWDEAVTGRQTHLVWPNIESRLKHNWTRTDFFLTQYWTGHGQLPPGWRRQMWRVWCRGHTVTCSLWMSIWTRWCSETENSHTAARRKFRASLYGSKETVVCPPYKACAWSYGC